MSKPRPGEKKRCWSKKRFKTEAKAAKFARKLEHRIGRFAVPYKCPFGDHWHNTTPKYEVRS